MHPYIIQSIGFLALIFVVFSFQKNSRNFTLLTLLTASLLFASHFFLLEAYTGAALNLIAAGRAALFYFKEKHPALNRPIFMWLFVGIFSASGFYTYSHPVDILPVIAMNIECFALWNTNTKFIRYIFFTARPFWMTYNIYVLSWAGITAEVFLIVSLSSAIWRFDWKKDES
ncbi:MAG: YgjV family protein [Spirochaetia bacterium]|nr:YgjV family protein [Spirochaetia bacterium]